MAPRHDVSGVPLQGGYIARQCPVVIQNRILVADLEADVPPEVDARMTAGIEFERYVLEDARVADKDGDWMVIPAGPKERAQEETMQAVNDGIAVIEQAFLPADTEGRRTGRPDLLVRTADSYVPVDIKHHRVLDPTRRLSWCQTPERLSPSKSSSIPTPRSDVMQGMRCSWRTTAECLRQ